MLRGRRSCTISERPTLSPTSQSPLTPLFPLDTSHFPVTPLFPLHTRNRGVTPPSNMTNRSISEFSQPRSSAAPFVPLFPLRSSAYSAPLRYLFSCLAKPYRESSSPSSRISPNSQIPAKNAKSPNITLRVTIILINNVGAPTFWSAAARRRFYGLHGASLLVVWEKRTAPQKREQAPALHRWRLEDYAERRKRAARFRSVGCGAITCGWTLRRATG